MNDAFNWWLLIVGLVIGAGLVWLVLADSRRGEVDVAERERASEARWIATAMRDAGRRLEDADALDILRLHEAYLAAAPPDELDDEADLVAPEPAEEPWRAQAEPGRNARQPGGAEARAPMAHPIGVAESLEGGPERRS